MAAISFGRRPQGVVPVAALERRAKAFERNVEAFSDVFVACGVAVAGGIGVGCALDERVRRILQDQKTRLERVDRAWTHAAAGCSIDGVLAHALDRS